MLKIICACGSGLGSSLIMAMRMRDVAEGLEINAQIDSIDFKSLPYSDADLFVVSATALRVEEVKKLDRDRMIVLDRVLDYKEMRAKLRERLNL